jgi:hypothetical protein
MWSLRFSDYSIAGLCISHLFCACYISKYLIIFCFIDLKFLWNSSLCNFLQLRVTFCLLDPKILLSTLFPNNLNLYSSLKARYLVTRLYKTSGKPIVIYVLIFMFLVWRREHKYFWTEWKQTLLKFDLLLTSQIWFWFVTVVSKYFKFATVSNDLMWSHDSSVGIALGYELDDWDSRVRFTAGAGNFSLHHRVQNGPGAHPASNPKGTSGSFPGGKAAGAWNWPLNSI